MAAPTVDLIYPNDAATGIPIAPTIAITFSQDIDLSTAKANVLIYGNDFDTASGPDLMQWIDQKTGTNPYFLKSPGLKGFVPCDYELIYVDSNGDKVEPQPSVYDETTVAYKHKLLITPKDHLAPNVTYTVYIIGDAEAGTSKAVSNRTVYDTDETLVTSTTGNVKFYGGYIGDTDDTVLIKITTAGDIGTAKYKWWYSSSGEGSAITGKTVTSRYRKLDDGLQVKFEGSGFVLDDVYTTSIYAPENLASSYKFTFTTGSGAIQAVPETASTSIIGTSTSLTSTETSLTVKEMTPADGATHQAFNNRRITIEMSEVLDASTVTDANVTVMAYPVSGTFDANADAFDPVELVKKLTVDGSKIIIDL